MKEKYIQKLMSCNSVDEFVTMFFGLGLYEQLSVMGERIIIPKGTILYRARKDEGIPLNAESDWLMPPREVVKMGRFNYSNKPVLYLGTMDSILPREIGLYPNDRYYLAKYKCSRNISVGSFLKSYSPVTNLLHIISMAVEKEDKLSQREIEELSLIDIQNCDVRTLSVNPIAPLYIHKCITRSLYGITNKLFDLILKINPNGLRYCSSFVPIELSGSNEIITFNGELEGNYALTEKAIKDIEYLESEYKIYTERQYNSDMSLYIKTYREMD